MNPFYELGDIGIVMWMDKYTKIGNLKLMVREFQSYYLSMSISKS